jgi:predicted NUDIX family NTP pyrophosphohydrolase
LFVAAKREFAEELGFEPSGDFIPLTPVKQKGGKIVHAWAFAGDCEPTASKCNSFKIQWPPRSGKWISVPEIDQAEFFDLASARKKINAAQVAFIDELEASVAKPRG